MGRAVWDRAPRRRRRDGLEPIGYRALDALRMEKGYRYYGTDLTMLDTPFEAGLGAFVRLGKGAFIGREALRRGARGRPASGSRRLSRPCSSAATPPTGPSTVARQSASMARSSGRLRSVAYGPTRRADDRLRLPAADLAEGAALTVDVFDGGSRRSGRRRPVDPTGARMRG